MLEDLELQLESTTQAYETAESRLQQCQAQLEKAQEQLRVQRTSAMGTDAAEELQVRAGWRTGRQCTSARGTGDSEEKQVVGSRFPRWAAGLQSRGCRFGPMSTPP